MGVETVGPAQFCHMVDIDKINFRLIVASYVNFTHTLSQMLYTDLPGTLLFLRMQITTSITTIQTVKIAIITTIPVMPPIIGPAQSITRLTAEDID